MKNPLLLKAKFEAGISLKQLVKEDNHDEVVELVLHSTAERCDEYFKDILPKSYRNEKAKLRFIEATGQAWPTIQMLVTADDNGEVIIIRPNIVRSVLSDLLHFDGFCHVHHAIVEMFRRGSQFAHVKADTLAANLLNETMPDELIKIMESPRAIKSIDHSGYMALHKAVFPDDPN